jgi:hypothetical protein
MNPRRPSSPRSMLSGHRGNESSCHGSVADSGPVRQVAESQRNAKYAACTPIGTVGIIEQLHLLCPQGPRVPGRPSGTNASGVRTTGVTRTTRTEHPVTGRHSTTLHCVRGARRVSVMTCVEVWLRW